MPGRFQRFAMTCPGLRTDGSLRGLEWPRDWLRCVSLYTKNHHVSPGSLWKSSGWDGLGSCQRMKEDLRGFNSIRICSSFHKKFDRGCFGVILGWQKLADQSRPIELLWN